MTQAPTAAEVAGKLTKAQRAIVAGDCRDIGNPPSWFLIWPEYREKRAAKTFAALMRLGILAPGRFGPTSLSPLGLAVRAILMEQDHVQ